MTRRAHRAVVCLSIATLTLTTQFATARETAYELSLKVAQLLGAKRYEEAIPLARQAAIQAPLEYGPKDASSASALHNLGEAQLGAKYYGQAAESFESALAIWDETKGADSSQSEIVLGRLLEAHSARNDHESELHVLSRRLTIQQLRFGDSDLRVAASLIKLGAVHRALGHFVEELKVQQKALAIREKALGSNHAETGDSFHRVATALQACGDAVRAEQFMQKAISIKQRVFGPDSNESAIALYAQGAILSDLPKLDRAVDHFRQALAIQTRTRGRRSVEASDTMDRLSGVLRELGQWPEAMSLGEEALATRNSLFGENAPQTATSLQGLAHLAKAMGDYEKARGLFEKALALREQQLGPEHPETLASKFDLAAHLILQGQSAEALNWHRQVLEARVRREGSNSIRVALSRYGIAEALRELGRYPEALAEYRASQAIREKLLAPDSALLANGLLGVAHAEVSIGRYQQAFALYDQALTIREKKFGSDSVLTAQVLLNQSRVLQRMGKLEDAEALVVNGIRILQRRLGAGHVDLAEANVQLAGLLLYRGQYEKATVLFREGLDVLSRVLGANHPKTLASKGILADALNDMGRYDEALPLAQHVVAVRKSELGTDHPDTALGLNQLAGIFRNLGDFEQAIQLYQQSFSIYERSGRSQHPDAALILNNLASVWKSKREANRAHAIYRRSLAIFEKSLDPEHPEIATVISNIAVVLVKMGRSEEAIPLARRALAIDEATRGAFHPYTAFDLSVLGDAMAGVGRTAEAKAFHRRALGTLYSLVGRLDSGNAGGVRILSSVAAAYGELLARETKLGSADEAVFYYKLSVNAAQQLRLGSKGLDDRLRGTLTTSVSDVYATLARLLVKQGRVSEAEQVLRLLKESDFTTFLTRQGVQQPELGRPSWTADEERLHRDMQLVAIAWQNFGVRWEAAVDQIRRGNLNQGSDTWKNLIAERGQLETRTAKNFDALQRGFAEKNAKVAQERLKSYEQARSKMSEILQIVRLRQQERRPATGRTASVILLPGDAELLTIVTTDRGAVPLVSRISREDLASDILAFKSALDKRTSVKAAGEALYRKLLTPVISQLSKSQEKGIEQFAILGFDVLRDVPYAALMDPATGQYLIQQYALVVATADGSGGFADLEVPPKMRIRGVALGSTKPHPAFGNKGLPAVSREVCGIVNGGEERACAATGNGALPGQRYLDENFTPELLRVLLSQPSPEDASKQPNFMHIATHYDGKTLLLGGGNTVTAKTLVDDWKPRASQYDLVVLSACSSGVDGAGVDNLGALMRNRGAKAVIATMWPIADVGAAPLMLEFYRQLGQESRPSKAEALRHAQIRMLRGEVLDKSAAEADLTHPYFWASYVLMGNWQ